MDDINVNSSSGSIPPVTGSGDAVSTTTSSTTGSQQIDTISTAADEANPLSIFSTLEKPIYLNVWSKIINLTLQAAKERILTDENNDIIAFKGMRINSILTGEAIIALQNAMGPIAEKMQELYDKQVAAYNAAKSAIDDYNNKIDTQTNADQDHIDTMNDATKAYNNADKSTPAKKTAAENTYNNAISAYNTYVNTTRVDNYNSAKNTLASDLTDYNSSVAEQNALIDEINGLRAEAGIPLLPHVSDAPSIPAQTIMPTAPSTSNPVTLPDATQPTPVASIPAPVQPPTLDELVAQYVTPLLDTVVPAMEGPDQLVDQLTQYHDFQRYYLGPLAGKVTTLPTSFVNQNEEVFLDQSVNVGSGSGVSLGTMIGGLSNENLNRLLSDSIATAAAQQANIPISPELYDQIRLIILALHSRAALGSSVPAFSLLSERLASMDENSTAVQMALSLAYTIQIAALAVSDDLQQAILSRLQTANPNADPAALSKLAVTLTAAANLSFALFAVSQLAQSLKSPELTGQVLSLINTPSTEGALASASTITVSDVLSNPVSVSNLKANISQSLAGFGNVSQDVANEIAKNLNFSDISDEAQLKDAIKQQIIKASENEKISSDEATALADRAAEFVKAEIAGKNLLDTAVQKEVVQHDYLTKQLQNEGVSNDVIAKIVPNIVDGSYTSRRELRDTISENLIASGIAQGEALNIATTIVVNNQSGILTYPPVSDTQLAENVTSHVTNQASADFGVRQSQQLAGLIVSALLGNDQTSPSSITNIIRTNLEALKGIDDEKVANAIREFLRPSTDLFQFNQRIMDPANVFVLSMWTGLMYSSKFKHTESIDVLV